MVISYSQLFSTGDTEYRSLTSNASLKSRKGLSDYERYFRLEFVYLYEIRGPIYIVNSLKFLEDSRYDHQIHICYSQTTSDVRWESL